MGKYDSLMVIEKSVLQRMAQAHNGEVVITWYLERFFDSDACLAALGSRVSVRIPDVPDDFSFYEGLQQKGFVALARDRSDNLTVSLQQPALDFSCYAKKTRLARWFADLRYDLVEQKTLRGKLIWLLLGLGLGLLSAYLYGILSAYLYGILSQ